MARDNQTELREKALDWQPGYLTCKDCVQKLYPLPNVEIVDVEFRAFLEPCLDQLLQVQNIEARGTSTPLLKQSVLTLSPSSIITQTLTWESSPVFTSSRQLTYFTMATQIPTSTTASLPGKSDLLKNPHYSLS